MGSNPAWCTIFFPLLKGIASKPTFPNAFLPLAENPVSRRVPVFRGFFQLNVSQVKFLWATDERLVTIRGVSRRAGRVAEGAPLLREYTSKGCRGFESPVLRHYLWHLNAFPCSREPRFPPFKIKTMCICAGLCRVCRNPVGAGLPAVQAARSSCRTALMPSRASHASTPL